MSPKKANASPLLVIGLLVSLAVGALGAGGFYFINQTPDAFAFNNVRGQIPGAAVRSASVELAGFHGRLPITLEGDHARLLINGNYAKTGQAVRAGEKVAIEITAGGFGERREATLVIREARAIYAVESMVNEPIPELAFRDLELPAGRMAFSSFAAPVDFAAGAMVTASSDQLRVIKHDKKDYVPVVVLPGEIFQLAHPTPAQPGESTTIDIELGGLSTQWTILAK
jgi:hypothetical protein